ncbi:acetyl-CoA carboxylase biotin carboxyl carrier protein [Nocardia gamkensis]|uniref:acetyl-CoA carboxylase biotin carboxyl carrier protein n=1 Tax=Nocardia gamkensis TaxID=352869 RepID=UPI0033CE22CF
MTAVQENAPTFGHEDYLRVLEAIQTGALQLLAGFPQQPSALRFQVGEVTVEAEWAAVPAPVAVAAVEAVAAPEAPALGAIVRAPSVGVFYRCPEPGADPFVEVGDRVSAGQQVGIVEAMKLMIPVTAQAGVITGILKEDGEPVQFDEPLFSYSAE